MQVLYGRMVARMFVLRGVVCVLYGTVRWCSGVEERGLEGRFVDGLGAALQAVMALFLCVRERLQIGWVGLRGEDIR